MVDIQFRKELMWCEVCVQVRVSILTECAYRVSSEAKMVHSLHIFFLRDAFHVDRVEG